MQKDNISPDEIEKGTVRSLDGTFAIIETSIKDNCSLCSHRGLCRPKGNIRLMKVTNSIRAKKGDKILFMIRSYHRFIVSNIIYLLPITFLFLGYYVGTIFFQKEISIIFTTLFFLIFSFVVQYFTINHLDKLGLFLPEIISKE